jgi:glutamate/tyrosine decarboxylase-like PLP-dependent enzyme
MHRERTRREHRDIGQPAGPTEPAAQPPREQTPLPPAEDESLRLMGYAFVDLVCEYLKGLEGRRVYGPVSPAGMDDLFAEPLPEEGSTLEDIVQECRTRVFPNTMAIGSRRYFGMMNPAPLPVAIFADALCSAMNQNVASWRHAPAGTAIEKRVIRWLCDLCGLGEMSFGTFVPGGSLANLTGLKLAVNRALGRDMSRLHAPPPGPELARLTFYVSSQAHYSFDKAIDLLGLGRDQLRKIPEDELFRIDLQQLSAALQRDLADGRQPCCIIGIAGTTNTGSIDKLDRLAELARQHGCWFHVDGAYGGAVMLSKLYGPMLRGIELADSITVDPHKWFYMPFSAGVILVREGDFLRKSFLVHPEYYMELVRREAERSEGGRPGASPPEIRPGGGGAAGSPLVIPDLRGFHMGDKVNFFQYGVQGSRRFDAFKVWLAFKLIGRQQYAAWVENDIELARILAGKLRRERDFELIGPNTLGICNVRWRPRRPDGQPRFTEPVVDRLNRELQELVEQEGDAWFSHTVLKGRVALRVNVENRRMTQEHVMRLVRVLKHTAARLLRREEGANGGLA